MQDSGFNSNDQRFARDPWSLVILAAAVAVVASFLVCEVYDLDIFWNVVIGKDIIARGEVPA